MNLVESLKEYNSIQIIENAPSWEEAITICLSPLLKQNAITENYIKQVIQKGKDLNFYYLLTTGFGMPHARPEDGVLMKGISLLIIKNGVDFLGHQHCPIYCLIGLAVMDNDQHIESIMDISRLFGDNEHIIQLLVNASGVDEIIDILENK